MIDDELSNLIRERQRRAECEAAGVAYVPDVLAARPAPHCDPETPAVPDVLLEPNTAPVVQVPDRVLPSPLLIRSPQVVVLCADHGGGSGSAIAPYGESSIDLYLDDIPTLTRSELYLITDNQEQLQTALDDNLELLVGGSITAGDFDAAVMSAAGVEAAAAAGIRLKALELRGSGGSGDATGLYAIAELTAMSRLVCNFFSQPLWAVCDSESTTGFSLLLAEPAPLPPSDRYRYRPAAFRSSTSSVEDANDQAALDAVSDPSFECVYVSDALTVTCSANVDPVFDHTYVEDFVYEGTPFGSLLDLGATRRWDGSVDSQVTPGFASYALDSLSSLRRLVTAVNVDAGLYPSASQADANDRAREAGIRLLNCFFPSQAAVVDCANRDLDPLTNPVAARMGDLGETNVGLTFTELRDLAFAEMDVEFATDPLLVTNLGILPKSPGPGADLDTSEGLRVSIPAGMVSSVESAEAAEEEARNHALGFLSCFWVSPAVTCSCVAEDQASPVPGSYFYTTAQLNALRADYSTSVSSGALTFSKGELGSSEDGFIPVTDTMDLCKASLVCLYCNQTVDPRCATAYDLSGNPSNLWNPQTDETLPLVIASTAGVSFGVTAGLPAGVICDSDPQLIQTLAVSTASLPPAVIDGGGVPLCSYGNRAHYAACRTTEAAPVPAPPSGSVMVHPVIASPTFLSPNSTGGWVTVAENSVQSASASQADAIAEVVALSLLECFFESPALRLFCGATTAAPLPAAERFLDSAGSIKVQIPASAPGFLNGARVHPDSTGFKHASVPDSDTPIDIPYGYGRSDDSPQDAFNRAILIGLGQLDCFFKNPKLRIFCGANSGSLSPVSFPLSDAYFNSSLALDLPVTSPGYIGSDPVHSTSTGAYPGKPVVVDQGVSVSYASQMEAAQRALLIGVGQLDCVFKNIEKIGQPCCGPLAGTPPVGPCTPGDVTVRQGRILANQMTSRESQADVDYLAKTMADAMTACLDTEELPPLPTEVFLSAGGEMGEPCEEGRPEIARPTLPPGAVAGATQAEADAAAQELAEALKICGHWNTTVDIAPPCPEGLGSTIFPNGVVHSHVVYAETEEGANDLARELGAATQDCHRKNTLVVVADGVFKTGVFRSEQVLEDV